MLRVNAIISRYAAKKEDVHEKDQFGGLVIDYAARLVYVDGERAELSPKVYDLLVYLVKNKGLALTREQLLNKVWGYDYYGDDRTPYQAAAAGLRPLPRLCSDYQGSWLPL